MQSPDSQLIVARFFTALSRLIAGKVIRGKQTFTNLYDINRRNLYQLELNHASDIFQSAWLTYLCRDFHVSPAWLLTGEEPFFTPGWDAAKVAPEIKKLARDVKTKTTPPPNL